MTSPVRKTFPAKSSPQRATGQRAARHSGRPPLEDPARAIDTTGALAPGSVVEGFVVRALVDRDDFLLRYRATSSAAGHPEVLIEEYWPAALVDRGADGEPVPREAALAALVEAGLEAFVAEASELASLSHPALLRLGGASRVRGTAYRLREEPLARTLARQMRERPRPPDERWLRMLAEPLLGALDVVHRSGRVHGNLRPGNILLRPDESPVLMDFGAAPAAIARIAAWRAPQPEPAFAAPELQLYGCVPTAAADIYSLAALLWYCSTGELPPKPGAMAAEPSWEGVLRRHPSLRYSAGWMEAIEAGLAFDVQQRPQSTEAFWRLLVERPVPAVAPMAAPAVSAMPTASPAVDPSSAGPAEATAAAQAAVEPDLWLDPSWSGLDIGAEPTAPMRDVLAGPRSRPGAFDPLPALRADDDREPTWQLDDFAASMLETPRVSAPAPLASSSSTPSVGDAPWPSSNARADQDLFEAPRPEDRGSHRPVPGRSRHWPWAAGGALVGGIVMLLFGLSSSHVGLDPSFEKLVQLATNSMDGARVASVGPGVASASPDAMVRDETASTSAAPPASSPGAAPIEARRVETGLATASPSSTIAPVRAGTPPRAAVRDEAEPPRKAVPERSALAAGTDPATICAPRTNFSLYLCMKTQCERSAWHSHPQCVALRLEDER